MPFVLYPYDQGLGRGDTAGPVQGTGLSVPGGVESYYEYNGLLMNYRKWWDTYLITSITGLDGADIRDAREDKPGQHGENVFQAFYSGRTIMLSGKIRSFSLAKMRDLEQALRFAFRELEEKPLIIRSGVPGTDVQIDCRATSKVDIPEEQTSLRFERNFQITLRASFPFIYSQQQEFRSGSLQTGSWSMDMVNNGSFDAPLKLKLFGPLNNVVITNLTSGKKMTFVKPIASAKMINVDARYSRITDADDVKQFRSVDVVTSDWINLVPGKNKIQITATSPSVASRVEATWNHTWL